MEYGVSKILICLLMVFSWIVLTTRIRFTMELSTQKLDSLILIPDQDSMWSNMSSTQTMLIALLDWISRTVVEHDCHAAWIWMEAMWRKSGLWIRITDLHRIRIQGAMWRVLVSTQTSTCSSQNLIVSTRTYRIKLLCVCVCFYCFVFVLPIINGIKIEEHLFILSDGQLQIW